MSIQEVILFVSSTSSASIPPVQFVRQRNLPVRIVRLDSVEERQLASAGRYIQIHNVPTLLVMYTDSNIQLFAGQEKIMQWFHNILQEMSKQRSIQTPVEVSQPVQEPPKKSKTSKKKKPKKKVKKEKHILPGGLYDDQIKPQKKSRTTQPSSSDSEEEMEIEFVEDVSPIAKKRPQNPSTDGLLVGPRNAMIRGKKKGGDPRMGNIQSIAEQMKRDRDATLGYRESDLPVST